MHLKALPGQPAIEEEQQCVSERLQVIPPRRGNTNFAFKAGLYWPEISLEHAQELMTNIQRVHEIFWATKGKDVPWYTAS